MTISANKEKNLFSPYLGDFQISQQLKESNQSFVLDVFEQQETWIVLGKGCHAEKDLLPTVFEDNVPVFRREGGGGTVLLSKGMVVLSLATHVQNPYQNKRFFSLIQTPIVSYLQKQGLQEVSQRGISDIANQNKKLLGSSMRRKASLLVYQAVLLVCPDKELISRYLCHPPKEPDYRTGRKHLDFVTSLADLGISKTAGQVASELQSFMQKEIPLLLQADFL